MIDILGMIALLLLMAIAALLVAAVYYFGWKPVGCASLVAWAVWYFVRSARKLL